MTGRAVVALVLAALASPRYAHAEPCRSGWVYDRCVAVTAG